MTFANTRIGEKGKVARKSLPSYAPDLTASPAFAAQFPPGQQMGKVVVAHFLFSTTSEGEIAFGSFSTFHL